MKKRTEFDNRFMKKGSNYQNKKREDLNLKKAPIKMIRYLSIENTIIFT